MHANDRLTGHSEEWNNQDEEISVESQDPASPSEDANNTWGSTIQSLMKIIGKNKQQLAYFQNRLKQAQFIDRPNARLVSTAWMHTDSLKDQINALELELMELERIEGGGVTLHTAEEQDLRWIWWWINEPSVQPLIRIDYPSFDMFMNQWRAWMADDTTHPLSIRLATGELIGFLLMTHHNQTARIELLILQPDYRLRGYGPEAVRAAIRMAFEQKKTPRKTARQKAVNKKAANKKAAKLLTVRVNPEHGVAVRCFEKAGLRSVIRDTEASDSEDSTAVYVLGIRREAWLRGDLPTSDGTVWTSGNATGISLGDFADFDHEKRNAGDAEKV